MFQQIGAELSLCCRSRRLIACIAQRVIGVQRKFRVNGNGARWVGQPDQAVGADAARQRCLEFISRRWQRVLYNVAQLHLAKGPARLLVGQNILKSDNLS